MAAKELSFIKISLPKGNEYTTEQTEALLANIARSKQSFFKNPFKKQSPLLALEITLQKQTIHFIAGSPREKINFLQSQILSQYPDVLIDPIKNPFLDLTNTQEAVFASLVLGRSPDYPLRTVADFQDTDPLASILSTLAKIKDPDKWAIFQIIISPTPKSFARNLQKKITEGIKDAEGIYHPHPDKQIFEEKLKKPPLLASLRLAATDKTILDEMAGSFGIYTNPKGNSLGLKNTNIFNKNKIKKAVLSHQISSPKIILNTEEIASLWHLPTGRINLPNIAWGRTIITEAPDNLPIAEGKTEEEKKEICFIAKTEFKNKMVNFGLKKTDRRLHFYVIGKTGTGKSTLIANMAISDIRKGNGTAVIDPHGDLINDLLNYIPSSRTNDVCFLNPADTDFTYPLNPLEVNNSEQKELVASSIVAIFQKLYSHSWGPRLEHILRNTLLTLVEIPNTTLANVIELLTRENYRQKIVSQLHSRALVSFWQNEFAKMPPRLQQEAVSPILNKVGQFVSSPLISKIINHPHSKINLERIMNEGKILLVDLSQGRLGEDNSALLGAMLITQIQLASMARVNTPEEKRRDFYLYVDEFQNFATSSFIKILSEARKYHLNLTLANQYMAQLSPEIQSSIFGNVGSIASFVVGNEDARVLAREFAPNYNENDLIALDRFQILTKLAIEGRTSIPFLSHTLPLPKCHNKKREKVIHTSQQRFGKKISP